MTAKVARDLALKSSREKEEVGKEYKEIMDLIVNASKNGDFSVYFNKSMNTANEITLTDDGYSVFYSQAVNVDKYKICWY